MDSRLFIEHLYLVITSQALAILFGLPLGILAYLKPKVRKIILKIVDIFQTVPALALLGIIMVFVGPGKLTVILGMILYSLLPIVRNTLLGFTSISPGIKEAAIGMGMTTKERLIQVELPLAFQTILTGVKIAVVNAIGIAVFAVYVGGGGLGSILNRGIRIQDFTLILTGTALLMVVAIVFEVFMNMFEKHNKNTKSNKSIWAMLLSLAIVACVFTPMAFMRNVDKNAIYMYDGDFTEPRVMSEMVKQLVEENTDLHVVIQDQMSSVNNYKAMKNPHINDDIMLSYDGTVLTTYLHLDPTDVPEGETIYDFANRTIKEKDHLYLLDKLGFDNTYAIGVPEEIAEKYNLETISDLKEVANELVFGAEHDFFSQEGSMKYYPFTEFYGLNFKDKVSVDGSLKYSAIMNGNFDVTVVYATDGLNRMAKLKILKDDQKFFPDYNGAFLIKEDLFDRFKETAPNLEEVLQSVKGQITNDDMIDMTYQVDVEKKKITDVVHAFLVKKGLVTGE